METATAYDHRVKVGNPGDLFKHVLLAHIVLQRVVSGARFTYAETHAGYPLYHLREGGEWRLGAGVMRRSPPAGSPLLSYWEHALGGRPPSPGSLYPGSSLLVHRIVSSAGGIPVLRLWDRSPPVAEALRAHFIPLGGADVVAGDGYRGVGDGGGADLLLVDPIRLEVGPIVEVLERLSRHRVPFLCWVPRPGTAAGEEVEASRQLFAETRRWYGVESAQWTPWREGTCGCRMIGSSELLSLLSVAAVALRRVAGWHK